MLERKQLFPNVIELNYQAGSVFGCNVYLIHDEDEWVLIDIGYEEVVDEVVDMIRGLDFPFSKCKALIATHADVDHIQGLARLKQAIKAPENFSFVALGKGMRRTKQWLRNIYPRKKEHIC